MKKLILVVSLIVMTNLQGFAQDPDLFQTWYLYQMDFESGDIIIVENFDPPIIPTLTILPSFEFNGQGACNTFEGLFIFSPPSGFEVAIETHTTTACGFFEDMFENEYFGFFFEGTSIGSFLESDPDGYQTLFLTGGPFTTCIFRNTPVLSTPVFQQPKVMVYPNPVKGELFIASEGIPFEKIKVYSISGSQVAQASVNENSIDVSGLSEGLYFLEVLSSEGRSIQKFIKK